MWLQLLRAAMAWFGGVGSLLLLDSASNDKCLPSPLLLQLTWLGQGRGVVRLCGALAGTLNWLC